MSFLAAQSKSFISVSSDNRIHLWDTDTRREKRSFVEKNHLAHSYTCFNWQQQEKNNLGQFSVGCSDGSVIVWDLARGVVARNIEANSDGAIPSDLVFSADSKSVFVCSSQNQVNEYRVSDGELIKSLKTGKKGVLKMALNPKVEVLAIAGTSIKLLDISSGRRRKLVANFAGGVTDLAFTQCGCFLASCGTGSREVLLFDIQATATAATPLAVVGVQGIPVKLVVRSTEQYLEVLVLFETSHACVIRFPVGSEDSSAATISNITTAGPVHAGCFGQLGDSNDGSGVTLVVGAKSAPYFVHTEYTKSNDSTQLQETVLLATPGSTKAAAGGVASKETVAAPTVLGPHETGGVKRPILSNPSDNEEEDDEETSGSTKRSKKEKNAQAELTMEERLENLSASMTQAETRYAAARSSSAATQAAGPTSDSLVTLIDQALQSGDDSLLEQCLGCEDEEVVEATARALPVIRVVALLKKLVAKFEKRPSRGVLLTQWLSAVLRNHTSYLISVPDLSFQLAGLSQMLEQRLSSYSRLATLGGRLDLLMHQVSSSRNNSGSNGSKNDSMSSVSVGNGFAPLHVYRED